MSVQLMYSFSMAQLLPILKSSIVSRRPHASLPNRSQVISTPNTLTVGKSLEVEMFLTKETLHELCSQMELGFDTCAFKVFLRALIRKD
ncbi:hypothetical protein EMCRGX_G003009 [Ephydatia muelleri]